MAATGKRSKAVPDSEGDSAPAPAVMTSLMFVQICEMHAHGIPLRRACRDNGITVTTFYRYKARHTEFEPEFQAAREKFVLALEEIAFEAAATADPARYPTMLIFMLKSYKPERYRDNVKIDHTGSVALGADFAAAMERINSAQAVH